MRIEEAKFRGNGFWNRVDISVADSWILATAIERNATLVHKDPEFDALSDRVAMTRLPYKKTK